MRTATLRSTVIRSWQQQQQQQQQRHKPCIKAAARRDQQRQLRSNSTTDTPEVLCMIYNGIISEETTVHSSMLAEVEKGIMTCAHVCTWIGVRSRGW
jgi:hypothetical protein